MNIANLAISLDQKWPSGSSITANLAGTSAKASTGQANTLQDQSSSPATNVTLSDRAKAIIERNTIEQAVADRLSQQLSKSGSDHKHANAQVSASFDEIIGTSTAGLTNEQVATKNSSDFDVIGAMNTAVSSMDIQKYEDQVRRLNSGEQLNLGYENMTEDERFVDSTIRNLVFKMVELEDSGKLEEAAALRSALTNGAITFQRTDDVPDLNLTYSVTRFADAGGGGMRSNWSGTPTGEPKALLDSGYATIFANSRHGAFFASWPSSQTA